MDIRKGVGLGPEFGLHWPEWWFRFGFKGRSRVKPARGIDLVWTDGSIHRMAREGFTTKVTFEQR